MLLRGSFRAAVIILTVSLLAAGCSDGGGFLNPPGEEPPVIHSVDDGTILSNELHLRLVEQRDAPASSREDMSVLVSFFDSEDKRIGEPLRYGASRFFGADPEPVPVPELLEPGVYRVLIELKTNGKTERKLERVIFLSPEGAEFEIQRIQFHPDFLLPNSEVILSAVVRVPEGYDPFLRWSVGDTRRQGLLSEGLEEFLLQAPEKEGFYPVTLEMFPYAPPSSWNGYSFVSPVRNASHRMIVRKPGGGEPGEQPQYFSLLTLQGHLLDEGFRHGGTGLHGEAIGSPRFTRNGDHLGYRLELGEGIRINDSILPFSESRLVSFGLKLELILDELPAEGGVILQTESLGGGPHLLVSYNAAGHVLLTLGVRDSEFTASTFDQVLFPGLHSELSIIVMPEDSRVQVIFADGQGYLSQAVLDKLTQNSLRVPDAFLSVAEGKLQRASGTTVIGGENGFSGLISRVELRTSNLVELPTPVTPGVQDETTTTDTAPTDTAPTEGETQEPATRETGAPVDPTPEGTGSGPSSPDSTVPEGPTQSNGT